MVFSLYKSRNLSPCQKCCTCSNFSNTRRKTSTDCDLKENTLNTWISYLSASLSHLPWTVACKSTPVLCIPAPCLALRMEVCVCGGSTELWWLFSLIFKNFSFEIGTCPTYLISLLAKQQCLVYSTQLPTWSSDQPGIQLLCFALWPHLHHTSIYSVACLDTCLSLPSNPATSRNLTRRRKRNISSNNVYFVLEGVFHIDIVHICMYCPEPFQRLAECPLSSAIYLPDLLNFINICSQKSWEGPRILDMRPHTGCFF